jgi:mannose-6-phosphate isomerase
MLRHCLSLCNLQRQAVAAKRLNTSFIRFMSGLFQLKGQVKHYDWGGHSFISSLLAIDNSENRPFAEYWIGIHAQGPAVLIDSHGISAALIQHAPQLSYLLKVLDVRDMLSIQVHPNKEMAAADFQRENEAGIPLSDPTRNYKDPNHKPELMVALSEFWLLHGFRSPDSLNNIFTRHNFLQPLQSIWQQRGYAGLYKWVMELPQLEVDEILLKPLEEMVQHYKSGTLEKNDPCFWAARAHLSFSKGSGVDRGIFSVFLFNLVHLQKGQGIFQAAGVPHAYLEGQNVEIMANSDNVLRGGLTPKHIDVAELLRHVSSVPIEPMVLDPITDADGWRRFPVPVSDFRMELLECHPGQRYPFTSDRPCILLMPEGKLTISTESDKMVLGAPQISAYLDGGTRAMLEVMESGLLFIAMGEQRV